MTYLITCTVGLHSPLSFFLMGFLTRFFSLRSKKNKDKKSLFTTKVDHDLVHIQEEDQEAAVSHLLRSSSARFAVVSEIDYASLPPLREFIVTVLLENHVLKPHISAHPINSVVPEASLRNTQTGTYTVTVHGRTQCSRSRLTHAEIFPSNATPPSPRDHTTTRQQQSKSTRHHLKRTPLQMTQRDSNSIHALRQDPSVLSLLNMYDDHGRLPAKAFSNTPSPAKSRTPARHNGSTLRQLLGNPVTSPREHESEDDSELEGDISWADNLLRSVYLRHISRSTTISLSQRK